jgi:hypothetical protein
MTAIVLLAPSTVSQKHAARLSADLAALGVRVGRSDGRRVANSELDAADKVVLLWTKGSPRGSALRATARRARAEGKLICARLDGAKPPKDIGRGIAAPRGRHAARAWLKLIGAQQAAVPPSPTPRKAAAATAASKPATIVGAAQAAKGGGGMLMGIGAFVVLAIGAGAAAYVLVPGLSDNVNAAIGLH